MIKYQEILLLELNEEALSKAVGGDFRGYITQPGLFIVFPSGHRQPAQLPTGIQVGPGAQELQGLLLGVDGITVRRPFQRTQQAWEINPPFVPIRGSH